MPNYDLKKVYEIEDAIRQKYGDSAVLDPSKSWTSEKEKDYLEQLKSVDKLYRQRTQDDLQESGGYLISKKLLNKSNFKNCSFCGEQTMKMNDEVYMTKYNCCFSCYIKNIEGRNK